MICVNFKLSKFHGRGSGYFLRAGRGELRLQGSKDGVLSSVPPSTPWKRQKDPFRFAEMKGKSAGISEFCLSILGSWEQPSVCDGRSARSSLPALGKASNLGAPILPGDCTRKENTFLGLAGGFFA